MNRADEIKQIKEQIEALNQRVVVLEKPEFVPQMGEPVIRTISFPAGPIMRKTVVYDPNETSVGDTTYEPITNYIPTVRMKKHGEGKVFPDSLHFDQLVVALGESGSLITSKTGSLFWSTIEAYCPINLIEAAK